MGESSLTSDWLARRADLAPCPNCHLRSRCLISAIEPQHLEAVSGHIKVLKPLRRGDVIYRAGAPTRNLFIVHAGAAKTSLNWHGGHEIICDYHLPGDTLGLDGLHTGLHTTTSVALETTHLCELSRESLGQLASGHPVLRERLCQDISRALARSQRHQLEISAKTAEQRLACFLLDLSTRLQARGYSPSAFRLPLGRHEIAKHLGMRTETLSRLLAGLRKKGFLSLEGREVRLLQQDRLRGLAGN